MARRRSTDRSDVRIWNHIEGALIARRIPPGLRRRLAFESWPNFDAAIWRDVVASAEVGILSSSPVAIHGADRDPGAIESARANAKRAACWTISRSTFDQSRR